MGIGKREREAKPAVGPGECHSDKERKERGRDTNRKQGAGEAGGEERSDGCTTNWHAERRKDDPWKRDRGDTREGDPQNSNSIKLTHEETRGPKRVCFRFDLI